MNPILILSVRRGESEENQLFGREELDQTKLIRSLKGCDMDSTVGLGSGL